MDNTEWTLVKGQWHAPNGVGIESLYLKFWLILKFLLILRSCGFGNGRLALLDRGLYRLKFDNDLCSVEPLGSSLEGRSDNTE